MRWKKLWIALLILLILTPLGIWLPRLFGAGGAWGEWGPEEVKKLIGYVPEGMRKLKDFWKAPITDYEIRGWSPTAGYLVSGLLGIVIVLLFTFLIGKILSKKDKN
jgi:hypothetical protein